MAKKPLTAMLMHPVVKEELFRTEHLDTMARVCNLVSDSPFRDINALASHIGQIEVLVTSWGCPRIDEELINAAPRLKLIAHLAGSVKGFIDDAVWRRGIQVVNAVAANAVPVAEYTVAAILFANKQVFQLNRFYLEYKENRAPWSKEAPEVGNYNKTVGIALMDQAGIAPGTRVSIRCIDGELHPGETAELPLYDQQCEIPRGKLVDIPERT